MNQNQQDIEEHLLLQYLQGNAEEELRASVEAWLNADSRNRRHLDQLESLWLETGKIVPVPVAVDVETAWSGMVKRIEDYGITTNLTGKNISETKVGSDKIATKTIRMSSSTNRLDLATKQMSPTRNRLIPASFLWRSAAMILLLIGMYSLYWFFLKPVKQIELASGRVVLHNTLPDGSEVALNLDSRLTYPEKFSSGIREVKLSGEAFFMVKRDVAHPFIVDAGDASIKVLGTSFRIKTKKWNSRITGAKTSPSAHPDSNIEPDQGSGNASVSRNPVQSVQSGQGGTTAVFNAVRVVEVTVIEGSVMLFTVDAKSGDTASVIIGDGETGILASGSDRLVRFVAQGPLDLFWANRSLNFRATTLEEVFRLLKQHYQVSIAVSDPSILECRLTASFVDEPIKRILAVIAESFGLTLETRGQNYLLTGVGCKNEKN